LNKKEMQFKNLVLEYLIFNKGMLFMMLGIIKKSGIKNKAVFDKKTNKNH